MKSADKPLTQRAVFDAVHNRLEAALAFHRARPGSGTELPITTSVVTNIGFLQEFAFVTPENRFVSVRLLPYEQRKPVEPLFGDMAVIVDIISDEGYVAQGVAYFECKIALDSKVRFGSKQPENYLANTSQLFIAYYETGDPAPTTSAGLAVDPHKSSVLSVPAGLILSAKRQHLPRAFTTSLAAQLVYRMFLGYDLDLRPGAVNQAFNSGATFYLHSQVVIAREFSILRSIEMRIRDTTLVQPEIQLMWQKNERLRELAIELGIEPEQLRSRFGKDIERQTTLEKSARNNLEHGQDLGRRF